VLIDAIGLWPGSGVRAPARPETRLDQAATTARKLADDPAGSLLLGREIVPYLDAGEIVAGWWEERRARRRGMRVQNGTDQRRQSHRAQSVPRRKCE
jgi:hypothetical protein